MKRLSCLMLLAFSLNVYSQTETLKWYSFSEAVELNKKNPKKFFIDIYTDWCGWCKVMDKNTFGNEKIAALIDQYFYAVKFNAEKEPGDIEYKGKLYQLKGGYHAFTTVLMNGQGSGYPTICYMDSDLNVIQTISGYQTPEQIEPVLTYFATGSYKTTPWETYFSNFKSSFK
jgi:uncharacterized protein YyaL (SSP411 family)